MKFGTLLNSILEVPISAASFIDGYRTKSTARRYNQTFAPGAPREIVMTFPSTADFGLFCAAWNSGTVLLAGTLAQRAGRNPHIKCWLERTVGAAFIALGVKLVFTKN